MLKSVGFSLSLSFGILTVLFSCSSSKEQLVIDENNWIDLTYSFDSTTLYWPNNPNGFEHHVDSKGITPLGYFYSSYSVCAPEHGGTHLDAPIHFAEGKQTVDELPINRLCGKGVMIDVSKKALKERDFLITIADIENWEKENGIISDSTIVLFKTGYGQYYPNREKYFGTALRGLEAIPLLHFPGLDPKAAKWLIDKRKVKAVGLDTPSLDFGQSKDFQTHRILMGEDCPGFENVANLDKLPSKGIYIMALPMKIGAGSGAPLRIVANVMKPLK
jgi:kynurenine formamidase